MSGPVWYYAHGDSEKGPFTTSQIKSLASAGKIRPDDLVWKEGMETWAPAREVTELGETPPAAEATPIDVRATPNKAPAAVTARTANTPGSRLRGSHVLAAVGVLTVVSARGCDTISDRYVSRKRAAAEAARHQFVASWYEELRIHQSQIDALAEMPTRTVTHEQQLREKREEIAAINQARQQQLQSLYSRVWQPLRNDAAFVSSTYQQWRFWNEIALQIGTLLLATGVLAMAVTATGTDRWVCFAILAAIACSAYLFADSSSQDDRSSAPAVAIPTGETAEF